MESDTKYYAKTLALVVGITIGVVLLMYGVFALFDKKPGRGLGTGAGVGAALAVAAQRRRRRTEETTKKSSGAGDPGFHA